MVDPATVTPALATVLTGCGVVVAGAVAHVLSERREERERATRAAVTTSASAGPPPPAHGVDDGVRQPV